MAVDFISNIVDALVYLWTFNLDMGDSIRDIAEWTAQDAGIFYDAYLDEDEEGYQEPMDVISDSLQAMADKHSNKITDTLIYLFTEPNLVEQVLDELDGKYAQEMVDALYAVYRYIELFPDGKKVKKALCDNVLSEADIVF